MAKAAAIEHTKIVRVPEPIVIRTPSAFASGGRFGGLRRAGGKMGEIVKRGWTAAKAIAMEDDAMLWEFGGAAAAGYASGKGMLAQVPTIAALGPEGTLALVLILAGRKFKSKGMRAVGRGLGCVTLYGMGKNWAAGGGGAAGGGSVP